MKKVFIGILILGSFSVFSTEKECGTISKLSASHVATSLSFEGQSGIYHVNGVKQSAILVSAKMNNVKVCIGAIDRTTISGGIPTYNEVYINN